MSALAKARKAVAKAIDPEVPLDKVRDANKIARLCAFDDVYGRIVADIAPRDPSIEKILALLRTMMEE
jgi:hypothetical protein